MSENFDTVTKRETVGIVPGVGILSIFRYIKYKSWYALAEYVDNAIDSYLKNREALADTYPGYQLMIDIELNQEENYIRISDNAAGIGGNDLERALRMAVRPPDSSGLSEFGMGMKAASYWFSPKWTIETQALGDDMKRKVVFDVQRIVDNETNELSTNPSPSPVGGHFTNILLADVFSMPTQHGVAKIREHLTSIYRDFIREDRFFDRVIITVNNKQLKYKAPAVLKAPPVSDKTAEAIEWRKELDFTCAGGQRVTGFAAIYPIARTKEAGFAIMRRGRVIEGSYDEPYRPAKVFGSPGDYPSQRIYGELHLDGYAASFTKDGVKWEDGEEDFMARLKSALKSPGLDLLKQAKKMRPNESLNGPDGNGGEKGGVKPGGSDVPTNGRENENKPGSTSPSGPNGSSGNNGIPTPLGGNSGGNGEPAASGGNTQKGNAPKIAEARTLAATIDGVSWRIYIELSHSPAHTDWMAISNSCIPASAQAEANERNLGVRISLTHSFTTKYCASDPSQLEPIIRLGAAFALAKTIAQEGGAPHSSVLMGYVNELLLKL